MTIKYLDAKRIRGSSAGSVGSLAWGNATNVTINGLSVVSTTGAWGNRAYASLAWNPADLASGEEYSVTFTTDDDEKIWFAGLESSPSTLAGHGKGGSQPIDYSMYMVGNGDQSQNYIEVSEGASAKVQTSAGYYNDTDNFTITMDSAGLITMKKGSTVVYNGSGFTAASGDYYVVFYPYDSGSQMTVTSWSDPVQDEKATLVTTTEQTTVSGESLLGIAPHPFRIGIEISSSFAYIGQTITSATFKFRKEGSPTGQFYCRLYNSSNVLKCTLDTCTPTVTGNLTQNLTTTSTEYTFTDPDSSQTFANGDRLCIEYNNGSNIGYIQFKQSIGTAITGAALAKYDATDSSGTWTTNTSDSCFIKLPAFSNLTENTLFEETNTRETYWLQDNTGISKSGCLGWWKFTEQSGNLINHATTANGFTDGVGSVGDGVVASSIGRTLAGKFRTKAFDFDGNDENIIIPDNDVLDVTGNITICGWIYPQATSGIPFSKRVSANSNYQFYTRDPGGGTCHLAFYSSPSENSVTTTTTDITRNAWHFIAMTITSGTCKMWVDMTEQSLSGHTSMNSLTANAADVEFSGYHDYTGENFTGRRSDWTLWNRALTEAELTTMYNSGNGMKNIESGLAWY